MRAEEYVIVCYNYGCNHSIRKQKTIRLRNRDDSPVTFRTAIEKAKAFRYSGEWDDVCLYRSREVLDEIPIVGFAAPYPKTAFAKREEGQWQKTRA